VTAAMVQRQLTRIIIIIIIIPSSKDDAEDHILEVTLQRLLYSGAVM
jgi:hypothetical protein